MNNIDEKVINAIRVISVEGIERAKSGHPGICLGSAPIAYTVFDKFLSFNPTNPNFVNRDRFVLSAGHGSMMLYTLLHVFGYNVTMDDLQHFRQYGSICAGHPERGVCPGVEVTTGPLGQGIANAVGMAMAENHLASIFNRKGYPIVDHYTYALCGDGCNMEGIGYEASSLAGTLKLNKLIVLYDKNNITIEGSTDIAFTEDVGARYKAMGWNVVTVSDGNNVDELEKAISSCKKQDKPSFVIINTVIGYGSPNQGTAGVHGAPLGEENIKALRSNLNYSEPSFMLPKEAQQVQSDAIARGKKTEEDWNKLYNKYSAEYPELAKQFESFQAGKFDGVMDELDKLVFDKPEATRVTGFRCINAVEKAIPSMFGGSADLTPSNKTNMTERPYYSCDCREGSNVHFGIREHAMSAICNGIACHGGLMPYCSTFFVFSDYMKNGIRLSALMDLNVTYILTHDSIGVGEDGPTHEPIEQLAGLRSIPNFTVFRPADGNETKYAYYYAFTQGKPCAIVLTRQNLPQLGYNGNDIDKGGYVLSNGFKQKPDIILIASGSEVQYTVEAQKVLEQRGISARVVSMPSMELFERQSESYKRSVLPSDVRARIAVEAGTSSCWYKYVGLDGQVIGIDRFGASGPYSVLFKEYGFTTDNVVEKALKVLNK